MEWYRLKKLYHSIFFTAVAGASSCNGKGIDFFCQGRIASAPDKRNPIVGGGCNTPATMGFYWELRKRLRKYRGGWRRKQFDSAHHDAPSNGRGLKGGFSKITFPHSRKVLLLSFPKPLEMACWPELPRVFIFSTLL